MRQGGEAREIKARDDQLLWLVLRVIADLSPCTKPSIFAHILGSEFAVAESTPQLVDKALKRLEDLAFIQCSRDQLSITDVGRQFLSELPPDVLLPSRSNLSSSRALMAESAVAWWQRSRMIWQDCRTRLYSLRRAIRTRAIRTYVWRRGDGAFRLWKGKVASIIRGRANAPAPMLEQAAKAYRTLAEVLAASCCSPQGQIRGRLGESAVSGARELVCRGRLRIAGSVSLVLAVSSVAAIAFILGEQGKRDEEAATASTVRPQPRTAIADEAVLAAKLEAVRKAIRERVSAAPVADDTRKRQQDALKAYYSTSTNPLLWVVADGLTERAKVVMDEIARADDYGLRASDYDLPKLGDDSPDDSHSTHQLADTEIGLSLAVLRYANDARGGRIKPSRLTAYLDPALDLPDPAKVLNAISRRADPAAYLRGFQPSHPQFVALRKKLLELRSGDVTDEEPAIQIPAGPLLKLGVEHEQVALLRTRLDLPVGQAESMFDETVAEAVRQFQIEHNTTPDGMVGPGTRRLLNAPHLRHGESAIQMRTILLNMERWRWLPKDPGTFYVTVNIPEFTLRVVQNTETVHTARVVVGKPESQTPVFSNAMRTVVFGPYWNVPNSIKVEELRPYLRQEVWFFGGGGWDTSVLSRHNLRVKYGGREVDPRTLDWNRVDIRSLHIYQPPGPDNVLGQVKFLFPNKHAVYMHDTPQRDLFAREVRAESHGCVRVQNPGKLASLILKHDQGWNQDRTMSAMENGYDQGVRLKQAIPMHITYFTAKVNDDGSISNFQDLYGHDARMAAALFGDSRGFSHSNQTSKRRPNEVPRRNRVTWGEASPADIVEDIISVLEN